MNFKDLDSVKTKSGLNKKIRVLFLVRGLTKGGVTRAITNILEQCDKFSRKGFDFVLLTDESSFRRRFKNIKVIFLPCRNKLYWDYIKVLPLLNKENPDIIVYSKNIIPLTHFFLKSKKINIIYDLAYFEKKLFAYRFWDSIYMKSFMKLSCFLANLTIVPSVATKKDLIERLKVSSHKVKVVYLGVEKKFEKIKSFATLNWILRNYKIYSPFIFYAGSISPRKNLLRALKAFSAIKRKIPHTLVITGNMKHRAGKVLNYINNFLEGRVKILGYISDRHLIALYSGADVFLYPSLYEGFGFPILEAQSCGCPVITSNISSMPEVAGKGAILVNPYDVKEIARAIRRIIEDKRLRDGLVKEGYKNVKRFSWKKCVKETLKVYKEVCEEK